MIGAVIAVVARELTRFARQRGRLLASLARPLLWLIVIGAGFERLVPNEGTVSYKQFLLPGLFGMVILFSTMLSALATVHDREFGPIRMLLVAPVPHWVIVVAKSISAALLGTIQVILLCPLIWIVGLRPAPSAVLALVGGAALGSAAIATVGMVIASRLRSIENFAGIMNFLMFPMFFLSSALYPATLLPGFLQPFVRANPLTYAIDLMRHPLLNGLYPGNLGADYTSPFDVLVLVLVTIVLLALAALLFGEEEHLGRVLLNEPPRSKQAPRPTALTRLRGRPAATSGGAGAPRRSDGAGTDERASRLPVAQADPLEDGQGRPDGLPVARS